MRSYLSQHRTHWRLYSGTEQLTCNGELRLVRPDRRGDRSGVSLGNKAQASETGEVEYPKEVLSTGNVL